MQSAELREATKFFSSRFHRNAESLNEESNYISSPLGAWILLAQVAGGNSAALSRELTERIENALGLTIPAAYNYANSLIKNAPAAIKAASAAWFSAVLPVDDIGAEWIVNTEQEEVTTVGRSIPSQKELDAWANENTLGIIESFPFTPDTNTVLLIANAIATKIQWDEPFSELKTEDGSPWKSESLLYSRSGAHDKQLFTDNEGNLFAVITAQGSNLSVHAVIADNPELAPRKVIAVAEAFAGGETFTLALPDTLPASGNVFTVKEAKGFDGDEFSALLPAWEAASSHKLGEMNLPYSEASKAISDNPNYEAEVVQVAKAKFNKIGFEAAAVSTLMMGASAMPNRHPIKRVTINFNHPFAVVAVHSPFFQEANDKDELWDDLPVFTAWVNEAAEVTE